MYPEIQTIFDTLISNTKTLVVGYSGYIFISLIGLVVAVFVLQWGWNSLMGIMKSDGRAVTFGSPLGYHGDVYKNGHNMTVDSMFSHGKYRADDDYYGTSQNAITFFGVSGDEMNDYVKKSAGRK